MSKIQKCLLPLFLVFVFLFTLTGCAENQDLPANKWLEVSDAYGYLYDEKTNYDEGWGSQEISEDLKIIGKDFIIVRNEYDGSEWWDFISLIKPHNSVWTNTFFGRLEPYIEE